MLGTRQLIEHAPDPHGAAVPDRWRGDPGTRGASSIRVRLSVLIGRLVTGVLVDYVAAKRLMSVVCIGGAAACGLYAAGLTGNTAFVCAVLIGAIRGAEFDVLSYVVKRLFGLATFGRVYGLVFSVFQLGAALGATILPLSRAYHGGYTPGLFAYAAALVASAALFVLLANKTNAGDPSINK